MKTDILEKIFSKFLLAISERKKRIIKKKVQHIDRAFYLGYFFHNKLKSCCLLYRIISFYFHLSSKLQDTLLTINKYIKIKNFSLLF